MNILILLLIAISSTTSIILVTQMTGYAQTRENEIIERALETVKKATTANISGINNKSLAYRDDPEKDLDTLAQQQKEVENQPTRGFIQITEYNKLQLIDVAIVDVDKNCNFLLVNLQILFW